jgi:hypothetical protein
MKNFVPIFAVAAMFATFGTTPAFAQTASSKFAANVSDITLIPDSSSTAPPKTVLRTVIKTPNKKDLLIGVSLETALFTQTQVKGRNGTTDTSSASATLEVSVLLDGKPFNLTNLSGAFPPKVVYDKRAQTLSATLGGVIQSCRDLNGDGVITVATECIVTDEMIQLILDTMAAHHFNFVAANLSPGTHTLEVQVGVGVDTSFGAGSASATAGVGRGSLTVEEVRAINQVVPGAGIEFDF